MKFRVLIVPLILICIFMIQSCGLTPVTSLGPISYPSFINSITLMNFATDPSTGIRFAKHQLLVKFKVEHFITDSKIVEQFVTSIGSKIIAVDHRINLYQISVPGRTLSELREWADLLERESIVEFAVPHMSAVLDGHGSPNDPNWTDSSANGRWGFEQVDAPNAWHISTGSPNTRIAIFDGGFSHNLFSMDDALNRTHPDLVNNHFDKDPSPFPTVGEDVQEIEDLDLSNVIWGNHHGLAVAGTAGAEGNNNVGIAGMCQQCTMMLVRISIDGKISFAEIAEFTIVAVLNNADVINLSLGAPGDLEEQTRNWHLFLSALDFLAAELGHDDIPLFVVATGNTNAETCEETDSPVTESTRAQIISEYENGRYQDNFLFVAATDRDRNLACYSNYGPFVEIAAPGGEVDSGGVYTLRMHQVSSPPCTAKDLACADLFNYPLRSAQPADPIDGYGYGAGTSFAAPMVTGLAGLIKSIDPTLNPSEIKQLIIDGARSGSNPTIITDPSGHQIPIMNAFESLNLVPNSPPSVSINQPAPNSMFIEGVPISFTGSATDPEDGSLSGASLVWTSNIDGQIGTGESFTKSDLSIGTHTITLTATDSQNKSASSSIEITIDSTVSCQAISFPDTELESTIRSKISKPSGDLTDCDVQGITTLSHGSIPPIQDLSGIENLENLESLILAGDDIDDISPIAGLTQLKTLSIQFGGSIIEDLAPLQNLTNLETVHLQAIVSDLSPLENLTRLRSLKFINSSCTVSDLSPLENLTNLDFLELGFCEIIDLSPLSNLTGLGTLRLQSNNISDISPLADLTNLRELDLGNITSYIGSNVAHIFGNNQVTDISHLTQLTQLSRLKLNSVGLTDISPLSSLSSLFILELENNNITDISPLKELTSDTFPFAEYHLRNNTIVNVSPLANKKFKTLDLSYNSIVEITPLVEGFNAGTFGTFDLFGNDKLDLRGNSLSQTAIDVDIPYLQSNGVAIVY